MLVTFSWIDELRNSDNKFSISASVVLGSSVLGINIGFVMLSYFILDTDVKKAHLRFEFDMHFGRVV